MEMCLHLWTGYQSRTLGGQLEEARLFKAPARVLFRLKVD